MYDIFLKENELKSENVHTAQTWAFNELLFIFNTMNKLLFNKYLFLNNRLLTAL